MKKFILLVSFLALTSICANLLWFYSSSTFSITNFKPPFHYSHPQLPITFSSNQFTYLGHGKQSIVFESPDQKHVLKLFYWKRPLRKTWYRHIENWLRFTSPAWIYKSSKKKTVLKKLFERYLWAHQELRAETGIIAVHFDTHTDASYPMTLIDRTGKNHEVDLAKVPFVLQKKAQLVPEYLNAKLRSGDMEGAKKAIALLQNLLEKRIAKGFFDRRQVYKKNYGFIEDQPVQIDIGKIKKCKNSNQEKELEKLSKSLNKFLSKHYPQLKTQA